MVWCAMTGPDEPRRRDAKPPAEAEAWSVFGYPISGMAAYGGIGWLVGWLTGLTRVFVPIGLFLGLLMGLGLILMRYHKQSGE
jgi:hypothetical protein